MQTCYIINGHPEKNSLAHANAEALMEAAKAQGLEAILINVDDYPQVNCRPGPDTSFAKAYHQISQDLAAADYIAITCPMWNLAAPGMLKNFIDGVAQPRSWFAYDAPTPLHKLLKIPNLKGLMKAKKVLVVWTAGGPTWAYKFLGSPLTAPLKTMFKVYGIKKFESISLGNLHGSTEEQQILATPFLKKLKAYKF